jgi:hypothetical protein
LSNKKETTNLGKAKKFMKRGFMMAKNLKDIDAFYPDMFSVCGECDEAVRMFKM